MIPVWPRVWPAQPGTALLRCQPEDFQVCEQLGFALDGEGEHCFVFLQKRLLNTTELVQRIATLSATAPRDIGYCGMKDRNAVTRQWFSVGLAGRAEPDWLSLEVPGDVQVLESGRHRRKLRRGVHRANRFVLRLREVTGDKTALEARLEQVRVAGVPNYFGEQRFGRNGSTLDQARRWMRGRRRITHEKRGLYFSALRAYVFNRMLADRVERGDWNRVVPGDMCMLSGTRSFFSCEEPTADVLARTASGDIHPGLPLWGRDARVPAPAVEVQYAGYPGDCQDICEFLEASGLELAWRPTRLVPDDFCWSFCEDDVLQLEFALSAGSYATALLAELVQYNEGCIKSGIGSEQD
jgi:tRNA pseudouridine13 synthase